LGVGASGGAVISPAEGLSEEHPLKFCAIHKRKGETGLLEMNDKKGVCERTQTKNSLLTNSWEHHSWRSLGTVEKKKE